MGDYGATMDTEKRVLPPIPFVYCFGLQNLQRHMCCRAIKTNGIGGRHTFISVHWLIGTDKTFSGISNGW